MQPLRRRLLTRCLSALGLLLSSAALAGPVSLFDGKTLHGWEGDTQKIWRVADGCIVAGTPGEKVARNEFLATTRPYTNFVLRLKVKLTGSDGFVNSGVQIRSQRIPNDAEMIGYQADIGAGWWGAIYDESRRNKMLAKPDEAVIKKALKPDDWNDYEIHANGRRIVLKLNGTTTVDYTEADEKIPQHGFIAVQIHGGGRTVVQFKDLTIEELP